MKSFREYLSEAEHWVDNPAVGDDFAINIREECLIETYIVESTDNRVVIQGDEEMFRLFESYGFSMEDYTSDMDQAEDEADMAADEVEDEMDEAKYQGREVPLGKPMRGDVKKSKVYVRGPKGNVVKVNFGDKTMRIKKNIPGRRKNFRARHNCDNPGPRWKARYWSCRAW